MYYNNLTFKNKMFKHFIIISIITFGKCKNIDLKIPSDFLIGTASSSYQVEGAWNVSDKGESNWDYHVHNHPEKIRDRSTGDVACDTYHKYDEDADILQDLGVDFYRFSMSWSRILPKGHTHYVSKSGLQYYHNLLDSLERRNITPFLTIYHVEIAQSLEHTGLWLNEAMAYIFADYARLIFREFGHRIKYFVTINIPKIVCLEMYRDANFPPYLKIGEFGGEYICMQNMMKAHALAYQIYDREFRHKYNGKVGYLAQCTTAYSKYENDTRSSDVAFEFDCGWQANAIFSKKGGYPEVMIQNIAERSKAQGLSASRLPTLSQYWIEMIKGSADFLGLNHYTSTVVESLPKSSIKDWPNDEGLVYSSDPKWPKSHSSWQKINPRGIRDLLNMVKDKYDNPPVFITEIGVYDRQRINDTLRMAYLYTMLEAMLEAKKEDDCDVRAVTIWSLLDSFEFNKGYQEKYGLIHVDFNSKNLTRTPKRSASWLKTVLKYRELVFPNLN